MSYIVEVPSKFGGKPERKIDLPRFAADLAKELNGELQPAGDYPMERQAIRVGPDELSIGADNHKKRVSASITAPDVAWGEWSTYAKDQKTESATVSPDGRSMAAIAKDIKKRVIEANLPALAARRAYAKQRSDNRDSALVCSEALKKSHPALNVRLHDDKLGASISGGGGSHYISASMDADGRVSIQRIGAVSAKQFDLIMAALETK